MSQMPPPDAGLLVPAPDDVCRRCWELRKWHMSADRVRFKGDFLHRECLPVNRIHGFAYRTNMSDSWWHGLGWQ